MSQSICLLVDVDEVLRTRLAKALSAPWLHVLTASNYDEAVAVAAANPPHYAVIDLKMPGPSGIELLRHLQEVSPSTRSLLLTGYGSIANAVEAMKVGAVNYLTKPADADEIYAALL